MLVKSFQTDAAATTGTGAEILSGQTQIIFSHGIRILALKQAAGAVLANDADWELWTDYRQTGLRWVAEELSPVNDGGVKLGQIVKRFSSLMLMFSIPKRVESPSNLIRQLVSTGWDKAQLKLTYSLCTMSPFRGI